ncbi:MAG: hypothetical protein AAFQ94_24060 [Bacteroidota bacterium]
MMNFFKSSKLRIDYVTIPDFGWNNFHNDEQIRQWVNPEQSIVLSINFFNAKPDIPTVYDANVLRHYYRQQLSQQNGGIVEVDTLQLKDFNAIKTIFKIKNAEDKLIYLASLTIPFHKCSYVIKIQAAEVGTTGVRESVIGMKLMTQGKISVDENGYVGWSEDPYDANYKEGLLMNLSEKPIYDLEFPEHALTQARALLNQIAREIKFSDEVKAAKAFRH